MAGLNFADIFETVVDTKPDAPALVVRSTAGDEVRLTYAELDARVNRLAHALTALGIGPGDHVGCHLYDGNQYVETTLAAFKVRAVPVNVNFRYVDEELEYLFDDADLRLVVTEPDLEDRADRAAARTRWPCAVLVADDRYEALLADHPDHRPDGSDRGPGRPLRTVDGRHHRDAQGRDVAPRGHLPVGGGRERQPGARTRPGHRARRRGPSGPTAGTR